MTALDRYDQAKQQAAQLKPGLYAMTWKAGGIVHTRSVILQNFGRHICYRHTDEDPDADGVYLWIAVYSAILTGTTFTPENNDVATQDASGDLLSMLCTVDIVGVHSLG